MGIEMKKRVFGFGFIFLLIACKTITLVPDYDADLANQIDATAKKIDMMYLKMMDASEEDDSRDYSYYSTAYLGIEVELNSILRRNRIRQKNQESISISENTLELWRRYKKRHKEANSISDADIELNMKFMSDQMYLLMLSEDKKRYAEETES